MLIERGPTSVLNLAYPIGERRSEEEQLIDAARSGDVNAYNQLVNYYQDFIFGVAYRVLGDEAAAADAVQEAFIAAYRRLPLFRAGAFKNWLYRIVINKCYDSWRAHHRRRTVSYDELIDTPEEYHLPISPEASPEQTVQRRELAELLQRHIAQLPIEQRTVLVLSDVHGLSQAEIAAITQQRLGTIKSRLSRGRARLRRSLTPVLPLLKLNG